MRAILIATLAIFSLSLYGQRTCFTVESLKGFSVTKPTESRPLLLTDVVQQDELSKITSQTGTAISSIIRIPVVVHILYNKMTQNVSDEQVKSQIEALNRDFRKRNSDTSNIPERFKALAADVEIEFRLAVVSPNGSATNGIIRKQTSVNEWNMDDKIKFSTYGGDDAWDSKSYLNIWVGNISRTLGYSSAMNGPAEKDGIVISNTVFGTIGISGPYNKGRTLVHEVGHWLGLKHIWGDAPCGDDEVEDTPKQAGFTTGCPNEFKATCGASATGDMYMNYMDFTNDACMYLFTKGQKERMRSIFFENGFRHSILNSKGLDSSSIREVPIVEKPVVLSPGNSILYPNPSKSELILKLNDAKWVGKEAKIFNTNGVMLQRIRITSQTQKIPLTTLKEGLFYIILGKGDEKVTLKFLKFD